MNVLILTPDAVGSTLLQRLITIYMNFHKYDRPVINLHELTNGLVKYYNPKLSQYVLGKKDGAWGYHQSLEQIVELLDSVDHYKTSRIAHYHIKGRQDTIEQQIPFYQYLNDNFYIVSCRRHNVFEHALSWCLSKITKKLNVYTSNEKINVFFDLYKNGIDIDPNSLLQTLNAYQDYLRWCNDHFNIANYFYYDEHLPHIEKYILGLPIYGQQPKLTWKDSFDLDFDTWNRFHYIASDLGTLALDNPKVLHQLVDKSTKPRLQQNAKQHDHANNAMTANELPLNSQTIANLLPTTHQTFLKENQQLYQSSISKITEMVSSGIVVSPPPIKKQTLSEKKHMIKNYNHLLEVYNQWILAHPGVGLPLDSGVLDQFAKAERDRWNPVTPEIALSVEQKND